MISQELDESDKKEENTFPAHSQRKNVNKQHNKLICMYRLMPSDFNQWRLYESRSSGAQQTPVSLISGLAARGQCERAIWLRNKDVNRYVGSKV